MDRYQTLIKLLKGHLDHKENEDLIDAIVIKFHYKKFRMILFRRGVAGITNKRMVFYGQKFIGYLFRSIELGEIISSSVYPEENTMKITTNDGDIIFKQIEFGNYENFIDNLKKTKDLISIP
ncbi:hypothetical protein ACFL6G_04630 [candidate division KSB1 bacterium]